MAGYFFACKLKSPSPTWGVLNCSLKITKDAEEIFQVKPVFQVSLPSPYSPSTKCVEVNLTATLSV